VRRPAVRPRIEYKWLVAVVFMFGLYMDILVSTALNVAVPRLQADFHAPLSTVEWTITGQVRAPAPSRSLPQTAC